MLLMLLLLMLLLLMMLLLTLLLHACPGVSDGRLGQGGLAPPPSPPIPILRRSPTQSLNFLLCNLVCSGPPMFFFAGHQSVAGPLRFNPYLIIRRNMEYGLRLPREAQQLPRPPPPLLTRGCPPGPPAAARIAWSTDCAPGLCLPF